MAGSWGGLDITQFRELMRQPLAVGIVSCLFTNAILSHANAL
jgi:hypothetical protein